MQEESYEQKVKRRKDADIGEDVLAGSGCATIFIAIFVLFILSFGNGTAIDRKAVAAFVGVWFCCAVLGGMLNGVSRSLDRMHGRRGYDE